MKKINFILGIVWYASHSVLNIQAEESLLTLNEDIKPSIILTYPIGSLFLIKNKDQKFICAFRYDQDIQHYSEVELTIQQKVLKNGIVKSKCKKTAGPKHQTRRLKKLEILYQFGDKPSKLKKFFGKPKPHLLKGKYFDQNQIYDQHLRLINEGYGADIFVDLVDSSGKITNLNVAPLNNFTYQCNRISHFDENLNKCVLNTCSCPNGKPNKHCN